MATDFTNNISTNKKASYVIPVMLFFVVYAFFSEYLWLTIFSGVVLLVIISSLQKPYIPPVLVYLFGFHWLQVFAAVGYASYLGVPLEEAFDSKDLEVLFWVTILQIGVMAFFLSRIYKVDYAPNLQILKEAAEKIDVKKVLYAYGIATLVFPTLIATTYSNSSLNQLVQSFAVVRKVLLLMMIFMYFLRETKYKNTIVILVVLEFILSFASYFSNFKEIIFFVVFVFLTVRPEVKTKQVLLLLPVGIILVTFLVFWSGVKEGYRNFLNQGNRQQQVNVSKLQALDYLFDKTGEFDVDSFRTGAEKLLYRLQYMQQYSSVYDRVPEFIPYENGKNITGTIEFLTMPRFLNANKKILDPSSKTSYYTGKRFANAEQGTSISMGYFCDLYIDFGLWVMFIPLLVITFMIGKVSNYIINSKKYNLIFTYSLFIGTILSCGTFESDIIFYLGSVRNYTVFMLLGNFFLFPYLNKYVKA
ncbi:MAG: hypothetical protein ACK4EY_02320 [Flavipsychrobacter sp.]